jgi:hypothetical protein
MWAEMNFANPNYPELLCFYGLACLAISSISYALTKQFGMSTVFGILIVFVSSEFWEIPIFVRGYMGVSGCSFPQVQNHIIVGFMAFLLIVFSKLKLTVTNSLIFTLNITVNTVALWFYSSIVMGWVLRTFTLTCLSYVFLKEIRRNG